MATPSNTFRKVAAPVADAVTVTLRGVPGGVAGEVAGPETAAGSGNPFLMGQDGTLDGLRALAVGCQLANEIGKEVVVVDRDNQWRPDWGRLEAN